MNGMVFPRLILAGVLDSGTYFRLVLTQPDFCLLEVSDRRDSMGESIWERAAPIPSMPLMLGDVLAQVAHALEKKK